MLRCPRCNAPNASTIYCPNCHSCGICGCCPCYAVGCAYCPEGGRRPGETIMAYRARVATAHVLLDRGEEPAG